MTSLNPSHPANPFQRGYWNETELAGFGFASVGRHVQVSKDCTIVGLQNISLGDHVRIDGPTLLTATTGYIRIGSYIHIGSGSSLGGGAGITLGDFANISQGVHIYSVSDDYSGQTLTNPCVPARYKNVQAAPVTFERHVIVGSNSVVLPGVTLGEGASVGALTLVNRTLQPWGIYGGTPARRLKSRARDLLKNEAAFLDELQQADR
ncbi:2%2C3%2C4%2C5-tetrahydropyridine-2%2C6-dicarboxy late N-acetyltransferase [Bordetella ansorpii]|uniref:2,3,4,5-tetrahydropyridine-2,6-dicarboxy late N-acetyltransferase n=1 Tax=Bordetella ansorpii TaxID=288768 RepID=A0A157STV9_9BORD|nr:acyltransferase [Bordetella ansorpii]SAI73880.1 2%2C3%2C4%2C5-tetrahydropyridine-2%2C6-dicarboxy late N-acetyltransferase [Bordetella ansorpii]